MNFHLTLNSTRRINFVMFKEKHCRSRPYSFVTLTVSQYLYLQNVDVGWHLYWPNLQVK
jgi:hypothetical protein